MSLQKTNIAVTVTSGELISLLGGNSIKLPVTLGYSPGDILDGTGANAAQRAIILSGTVTSGSPVTIDLTAVAWSGPTANLSKIKAAFFLNVTQTSGQVLLVGGAASNAWEAWTSVAGSKLNIGAGGCFPIISPIDGMVVDGTHKNLKIDCPSGSVDYVVALISEGT